MRDLTKCFIFEERHLKTGGVKNQFTGLQRTSATGDLGK